MNYSFWLLALSVQLLLSSCAAPGRQSRPVEPDELFKNDYVDVRAPNSEGWRLTEWSSRKIAFVKRGDAPGEGLGATIFVFDLQPTDTPEQFATVIRRGMAEDTNPKRHQIIELTSDYMSERGYPCLRVHGLFREKILSTSVAEPILLETESLYCRNPAHTDTGFAAGYSHLGRNRYPALREEAQKFLRGVQVPSGH